MSRGKDMKNHVATPKSDVDLNSNNKRIGEHLHNGKSCEILIIWKINDPSAWQGNLLIKLKIVCLPVGDFYFINFS